MEVLIPIFGFGVFGLIIWFAVNASKRRQAMYIQAAQEIGLDHSVSGTYSNATLYGEYKGLQVEVATEVHGSGKHKTTYTRFKAVPGARLPSGLRVTKEGLGGKIGKFFGGQDIQLGDKTLDDALLIKGDSEQEVRAWFRQSGVGSAVMQLIATGSQARLIQGEGAVVLMLGHQRSTSQLITNLDRVVDIARHMGGAPMLEQRSASDLFFDPDASDREASGHEAPKRHKVASPVPIKSEPAKKKRWGLSDMQGGQGEPSAPPPPAGRPKSPAAKPATKTPAKPTAGPMVDSRLMRLADRDLGYRERSELLSQLEGVMLSVQVQVKDVERSRGFSLDAAFRDGRTLVGQIGPCQVGVAFPKARDAELDGMSQGSTVALQVKVLDWDNFYRRASMQVV